MEEQDALIFGMVVRQLVAADSEALIKELADGFLRPNISP
jgi:hypothetical protein